MAKRELTLDIPWSPNFKVFTSQKIDFPVACETKFDGEFVYWDGRTLINRHQFIKESITNLPNKKLYGELYYGEGKEFYSEIHSHPNQDNKVILFDTGDYGSKSYLHRRADLEILAREGYEIVPMVLCDKREELWDYFEYATNQGYEGIVVKQLNTLTDSEWIKIKKEQTDTLLIRGLRKGKSILTVAMGTTERIYGNCSLHGWDLIAEMLQAERRAKGDKWITGENEDIVFIDSDIKLEIKSSGLTTRNMLRNARVGRIRAFETPLTVMKGETL